MKTVLIKEAKSVRDLIDYILNHTDNLLEYLAVATNVDYLVLIEIYEEKIEPSKTVLTSLCNIYCQINLANYYE